MSTLHQIRQQSVATSYFKSSSKQRRLGGGGWNLLEHLEGRQLMSGGIAVTPGHVATGPFVLQRPPISGSGMVEVMSKYAATVTSAGVGYYADFESTLDFATMASHSSLTIHKLNAGFTADSGAGTVIASPGGGQVTGRPLLVSAGTTGMAVLVFLDEVNTEPANPFGARQYSLFGVTISGTGAVSTPVTILGAPAGHYIDTQMDLAAGSKGMLLTYGEGAAGSTTTMLDLRSNTGTLGVISTVSFDTLALHMSFSDIALNGDNQSALSILRDGVEGPSNILSFRDASLAGVKTFAAYIDNTGAPALKLDDLGFTFSGGIDMGTVDGANQLADQLFTQQIAALPDGNFAALLGTSAYRSGEDSYVPPGSEFYLQVFTADGVPVGSLNPIKTQVSDVATHPSYPKLSVNAGTQEVAVHWLEVADAVDAGLPSMGFAATVYSSEGKLVSPAAFYSVQDSEIDPAVDGAPTTLAVGFSGRSLVVANRTGYMGISGKEMAMEPTFSVTSLQNVASGPAEKAPLITVVGLAGAIADGSAVTDGGNFGSTAYKGSTGVTRTFTVSNPGSSNLTLSGLAVPSGYKVVDSLVSTLAPGASDTFSVVLQTGAAGTFAGDVKFKTNVVGNETFNFGVTGVVNASKSAGGTFTFDSSTKAADRTFTDENGNGVVFSITGKGTGTVVQESSGKLVTLELSGTDAAKSSLGINVTKGKMSIGDYTTIGGIIVGAGGLSAFTGAKVNLAGGLSSGGIIKALTLRDVLGEGQRSIEIGGGSSDKTTLAFGLLRDVSVVTGATVTSFKAIDWQDENTDADKLQAFSLGSLAISGKASSKLAAGAAGDMEADISLTQSAVTKTAPVISALTVNGSAAGEWNLGVHKATSATIKGNASGLWSAGSGLGSLTVAGNGVDLLVQSGADIGSVSFKGSLTNGSFFSNKGMGAMTVAGKVSGSAFFSQVKIGQMTFGDVDQLHVESKGDIAGIAGKGTVLGLTVNSGGKVGSISGVNMLNSSFNVVALGSLTTKGQAATKSAAAVAGDFSGGVLVNNAGVVISGAALGSVSIAGQFHDGTLSVGGKTGALTFGSVNASSIHVRGDIASFTSKGAVKALNLVSLGAMGAMTSQEWQGGLIAAGKLTSFTTKGQAATKTNAAVAGDFSGVLSVSGVDVKSGVSALGSVAIAGAFNNGRITVAGKSGALTVGAAFSGVVEVSGDLASFTSKGLVHGIDMSSQGSIGGITVLSWLGGSVSADKVASITTKGQSATKVLPFIPGNFVANVTVSGEGVSTKQNALGTVSIAGMLSDSRWRISGNAGTVSVGAMQNASIFVGVKSEVDALGLPTSKAQFAIPAAMLAGFTVTGKGVAEPNVTASFINSRVAAGVLANVSLRLVALDPLHTSGFVGATKITKYSRQIGPKVTDLLKVSNKTVADVYDPVDGSGDVGYRLQIVG
jgi:hypothetical protein